MPSMMPTPPPRNRWGVVLDVTALILIVAAVVGVGFTLFLITPVALMIYGFVLVGVAGVRLAVRSK